MAPYQYNPSATISKRETKNGQNHYQVKVNYPDPDRLGYRLQRAKTFTSEKAAKAWRDEQLAMLRKNPQSRKPTAMTVKEFMQRWLDDYATGQVRSSTMRSYRQMAQVRTRARPPSKTAQHKGWRGFYCPKISRLPGPSTLSSPRAGRTLATPSPSGHHRTGNKRDKKTDRLPRSRIGSVRFFDGGAGG